MAPKIRPKNTREELQKMAPKPFEILVSLKDKTETEYQSLVIYQLVVRIGGHEIG